MSGHHANPARGNRQWFPISDRAMPHTPESRWGNGVFGDPRTTSVDGRRYPSHRAIPVRNRQRGVTRIATVILRNMGVALTAVVTTLGVMLFAPATAAEGPLSIPAAARPSATADLSPFWLESVAAKVLPSVVTLQIGDGDRSTLGSGVILDATGLILTNDHVVAALRQVAPESARTLVRLNDGRTAAFDVVATDPRSDVAVVRARGMSGLTPISIGSSASVRVGQPVVAVGSPLGLDGTVTHGIVSALHRPVSRRLVTDDGWVAYDAIQIDAPINPGNSGGALVGADGRLIGINAAEAVVGSAESSGRTVPGSIGLGFAITVEDAVRIAAELVSTGRASHAWLGARLSTEWTVGGARITDVAPGSPAAAAGLTPGALVTKVGDQRIENGGGLIAEIQSRAPNSVTTLVFTNTSGTSSTVAVRLGSDLGRS